MSIFAGTLSGRALAWLSPPSAASAPKTTGLPKDVLRAYASDKCNGFRSWLASENSATSSRVNVIRGLVTGSALPTTGRAHAPPGPAAGHQEGSADRDCRREQDNVPGLNLANEPRRTFARLVVAAKAPVADFPRPDNTLQPEQLRGQHRRHRETAAGGPGQPRAGSDYRLEHGLTPGDVRAKRPERRRLVRLEVGIGMRVAVIAEEVTAAGDFRQQRQTALGPVADDEEDRPARYASSRSSTAGVTVSLGPSSKVNSTLDVAAAAARNRRAASRRGMAAATADRMRARVISSRRRRTDRRTSNPRAPDPRAVPGRRS